MGTRWKASWGTSLPSALIALPVQAARAEQLRIVHRRFGICYFRKEWRSEPDLGDETRGGKKGNGHERTQGSQHGRAATKAGTSRGGFFQSAGKKDGGAARFRGLLWVRSPIRPGGRSMTPDGFFKRLLVHQLGRMGFTVGNGKLGWRFLAGQVNGKPRAAQR